MNRLGNRIASAALATVAAASLAACGGGSHSAVPRPAPAASTAAQYNGPLTDATLKITIPVPTTSSKTRRPAYVSSSTSKVVFTLNSTDNAAFNSVGTNLANFNASQLGAMAVTLGSAQCPGSGPWTCTLTIKLPPGSDNITVMAEDSSSNVLSEQIQTFTVTAGGTAGGANNFSIILDANASTMTIGASSGFCAASFTVANGTTVPTIGTSPVTFTVGYTDLAGKTIVGPGLPLLKINGSSTSGTITGTGGNVAFTINQAAQTFTLAASATGTTATIPVTAVPPASDGLSFSKALSFTLQSGGAEPASFLANAEQIINGSGVVTGGVIHLWTITLGASDTFTPFSTASLASTNPGAGNDVDFPNDLLFDGNGDLLIANGGAGSPDFGNFACVPAGAISTGANVATVLTTNLDDPTHIALGTDSSVDLVNGAITTYDDVEFLLNGTYSAAPATRDVARTGTFAGTATVALPATTTNPSGSYADGLFDGTARSSSVKILHPDGTSTTITDPDMALPRVAYDTSLNNELVIVNDGRSLPTPDFTKSNFMLYHVSPVAKVSETQLTDEANGPTIPFGPVAVSPDGHLAIIVSDAGGFPELNVYTSAHTKIAGSLSYGAVDCATLTNFVYGGPSVSLNIANKLLWLSNTKLLVELYSQSSHIATSANGLYTYDVTLTQAQTGCDSGSGGILATSTVKQTGFQHLSNAPLAAAYKP